MNHETMRDRFRGCLIGGAAGDALGYEVEFMRDADIKKYFGAGGIRRYALHRGKAVVSDDTQMTLYTANGLLCGAAAGCSEKEYAEYIGRCYLDWLATQEQANGRSGKGKIAWLNALPEMNVRRAPGNTCLSALMSGEFGTMDSPLNSSKGCGGVMRTAPIGLMFDEEGMCQRMGAAAAVITHGHELGYLPAAMLSGIVCLLVNDDELSVRDAVERSKETMKREFAGNCGVQSMSDLIDCALRLTESDMDARSAIRILGEGWVGDEALAIAVYCAVKYENDFEGCLVAAVNHCGDSDSTGAIAGNILGAKLGLAGINECYLKNLELIEEICEVADDLYDAHREAKGIPSERDWRKKYILTDAAEDSEEAQEKENIEAWFERLLKKLEK